MTALRTLARYARARTRARSAEQDRCELCGLRLGDRHPHVVDVGRGALRCACRACALLFERDAAADGRFRTVPQRILHDPDADLRDRAWADLGVPVGIACLQYRSPLRRWLALFPSPAGMAEAEVDDEAWRRVACTTGLADMVAPDVEALLVWRPRGDREGACYLVPIDRCYELVTRVRRHWEGIQGGDVGREVEAFVAETHERSRPAGGAGGTRG